MTKLLRAAVFAAKKHSNQRRKDAAGTPYINHCVQVAQLMADHGCKDEDVLCAAMLHDTLEDTATQFSDIESEFGSYIANVVIEVTDDKKLPSYERKELQVFHAPYISKGAKLVKLADKICNVRELCDDAPVGWSLERKRDYATWASLVVAGLRGCNPELEAEWDRVYKEMDDALKTMV